MARAQQPRRGGTVTGRAWDPSHFHPHLTVAYKTIVPASSGTFAIDGDLPESWTQPNETTYVFTRRRGTRGHPKRNSSPSRFSGPTGCGVGGGYRKTWSS